MSEISGSETIKILGARISRRMLPWMIGFVVVMTIISYLFFGGSSYDGKAAAKQKRDEKITTAEKQSEAGTEDGARKFIDKEKAEIAIKAEQKAAKEKADKEALAKMVGDSGGAPSQYPLPGNSKVDPVEYDQLKKAKDDAIRKESGGDGSSLSGSNSGFYEDYDKNSNGINKFVPGSGIQNGQSQGRLSPSDQEAIDRQAAQDPQLAAILEQQRQQKKALDDIAAHRAAAIDTLNGGAPSAPKANQTGPVSDATNQNKSDASTTATTSPVYPTRMENRFVLTEGSTIPCVLEGEVNSELPGRINCRVVYDIYDSIYGSSLLIPKGSRVMGQYGSSVKAGQERLAVAFNRIILANGRSVIIPMDGADSMGRGGVAGRVDNQFWKMFGPSLLIAAITQATTPAITTQQTPYGPQQNPYVGAAGQVLGDVSNKILSRYQTVGPIIRIDMGTRLNIIVTKDMAIPPDGKVVWDASGMIKSAPKKQ